MYDIQLASSKVFELPEKLAQINTRYS